MENWDDYRLILALYRGQTLRNAAKQLALNHSTVSRRLDNLKLKYGADVFEAMPSGYKLTNLGQSLLRTALKIESFTLDDKRLKRAQDVDLTGNINLSIPPVIGQFLLLDNLHKFQQLYPQISLNIQTSYQLTDIDKCESDIVIRISNQPSEHLVGHRLFPIMLSYYASRQYLQDHAIDNYQWITSITDNTKANWISDSPFPNAKVSLKVEDLVLRHYAAAQNYGMIMGACYIADSMSELVRIDQDNIFPYQDIWVLTHPDLKKVPRIKTLMVYLVQALREKRQLICGETISL